ncbi:hypothetical protein D3D02_19385, partial [Halobellus sp. Atlit-38R]
MGRRLLPGRRRGRDEAVVAMSGDESTARPTGDDPIGDGPIGDGAHGDFHETDARSPTVAVVASLAAAGVAATAGLVASP